MRLTLSLLTDVARQVIGDSEIALDEAMSAVDVPGWDSLNHTLIVVELSQRLGLALDASKLSQASNIAAFIAAVNGKSP